MLRVPGFLLEFITPIVKATIKGAKKKRKEEDKNIRQRKKKRNDLDDDFGEDEDMIRQRTEKDRKKRAREEREKYIQTFFSIPEYLKWKDNNLPLLHKYDIKYYKVRFYIRQFIAFF